MNFVSRWLAFLFTLITWITTCRGQCSHVQENRLNRLSPQSMLLSVFMAAHFFIMWIFGSNRECTTVPPLACFILNKSQLNFVYKDKWKQALHDITGRSCTLNYIIVSRHQINTCTVLYFSVLYCIKKRKFADRQTKKNVSKTEVHSTRELDNCESGPEVHHWNLRTLYFYQVEIEFQCEYYTMKSVLRIHNRPPTNINTISQQISPLHQYVLITCTYWPTPS